MEETLTKTLIIIDMQNDFISGSLANEVAEKRVEPMCEYIRNFEGKNIFLTQDTHSENYLSTPEGKKLPIVHCIKGTKGWSVDKRIIAAITDLISKDQRITATFIEKNTFGTFQWRAHETDLGDEIQICGTVSEICVISNALILKAIYPDKKIVVLKDLCAGITQEKHYAAMSVMDSCQIEVR